MTLNVNFSSNPISAFGFFGTDIADSFGDLVVDLTNSLGVTTTRTLLTNDLSNNNNVLFWGFFDTTNTYTRLRSAIRLIATASVSMTWSSATSSKSHRPPRRCRPLSLSSQPA